MKNENITVVISHDDFKRACTKAIGDLVLKNKNNGAAASLITVLGATLMAELDHALFDGKKDLEAEVEE